MRLGEIPIKPKILFLDRFYYPDEQATSIYLTELINALSDDFQIEVLCGPPAVVTDPKNFSSLASRVYEVPCLKLSKRILFARFLNDLSFLFYAFIRGLFIRKPALLVSQTSPPGVWWVGFLLSLWHRIPWIHISKDVFPENLKALSYCRDGFFYRCLEQFMNYPLKCASKLLVIGKDMEERFLKKGIRKDKIFRTTDWVDTNFIRPLPKTNPFSLKYNLKDKFVVLYAGNFGRVYNLEDLLKVAEKLQLQKNITFLFVGNGALKDWFVGECRKKKLRNIVILPFQPRGKLPEVLASADVSMVLLQRGMAGLSVPSKIYSILASGRPVIACVDEQSDIARIVKESRSGFVVSAGDVSGLSVCLLELFRNQGLRVKCGENARKFIEENRFQERAFSNYRRVFLEAVRQQGPKGVGVGW